MDDVVSKLIDYEPKFESAITELNDFFLAQGLVCKKKFRLPFYYGKTWVCYLNIPKPRRKADPVLLELCFLRGIELPSGQALLDFKKRTMIGGLSFAEEIDDWDSIMLLTQESMELDKTVPYTFKKKK